MRARGLDSQIRRLGGPARYMRTVPVLLAACVVLTPAVARAQNEVGPQLDAEPTQDEARGPTVVPIPYAASDPNRGFNWGVLLSIFTFRPDATGDLWVPSVSVDDFGVVFGMRYFHFGARDSQLELHFLQGTDHTLDLFAEATFPDLTSGFALDWMVRWREEPFMRFFGIGPDTGPEDESAFEERGLRFDATAWWRITPRWRLGLRETLRFPEVRRTIVDRPQTLDVYPDVPGVRERPTVLWHGVRVQFDTRDSREFPRRGFLFEASYALAARALAASFDANRMRVDASGLIELARDRLVVGLHGAVERVAGPSTIPFQALATLGGHETWRGGPWGRFTDRRLWIARAEVRWMAVPVRLFGYDVDLEFAPFADIGQVFSRPSQISLVRTRVAYGLGLRALVRPRVKGVVDVAVYAGEFVFFTTLTYPF